MAKKEDPTNELTFWVLVTLLLCFIAVAGSVTFWVCAKIVRAA